MTYVMNMKEVLCMFGTTVIKCHSLSYANMTLFEMLLWHLDINQYIITCQCLCHDNLTVLRQHNLSLTWHSRLIIKLRKPLRFIGQHYIKLSGGWFWHCLSWSHYNFLMTNSICTTVVEVMKNILDTVIMASWQPMSKPTTWQFNLILCQVAMTKTLTGYDVMVYVKIS